MKTNTLSSLTSLIYPTTMDLTGINKRMALSKQQGVSSRAVLPTNETVDFVTTLIRNTRNVTNEGLASKLTIDEHLIIGDRKYWAWETEVWSHRKKVYIWMQGPIPAELKETHTPLILDWSMSALESKDAKAWPPAEALLSELLMYKIVEAGISQRERNKRWPKVFQTAGQIIITCAAPIKAPPIRSFI